jgi:hypothetical protein
VCNELAQRTCRHAETLSRIAFALISLDSRQCTAAVRINVDSAGSEEDGQNTSNGLRILLLIFKNKNNNNCSSAVYTPLVLVMHARKNTASPT